MRGEKMGLFRYEKLLEIYGLLILKGIKNSTISSMYKRIRWYV
ncbi:protein of unknown function [Candidatus Nitrosocosmicus franklandus]|uniref:Uncharacterized protein n=1 Tax=Candidatus Nitrosocosmicus franklandianus TaxID=1798806 RepID=A0A484I800_9ARCH|nr:protein of unknown function [Candidatus Nitrosocosmicus franklandus]